MTKTKINQIYYLNREIEMWQRKLTELREGGLQSPKLDGMPRSARIADATGDKAASEADIETIIEGLLVKTQMVRKEIYDYINEQEDSLIRQIIMYRCVSLCSWNEVAIYVGGGNTAESVRKIFDRHFEKKDSLSVLSAGAVVL